MAFRSTHPRGSRRGTVHIPAPRRSWDPPAAPEPIDGRAARRWHSLVGWLVVLALLAVAALVLVDLAGLARRV